MQLFRKTLSGMANNIDPQPVSSGSTLFAHAILSETLVYYFRTFTVIKQTNKKKKKKIVGLPKAGLSSGVVLISGGLHRLYIIGEQGLIDALVNVMLNK